MTKLLGIALIGSAVNGVIVSALLSAETPRRDPALAVRLQVDLSGWDRRGLIKAVRLVLVSRAANQGALPRAGLPALIVSVAQDDIFPTRLSRHTAGQLPNASRLKVATAAHLVPVEQPEVASKLILGFVKRLSG